MLMHAFIFSLLLLKFNCIALYYVALCCASYIGLSCVVLHCIVLYCIVLYTGGILQRLDTDVHSAATAKTSTAL